MERTMQLYWEAVNEVMTLEERIRDCSIPLRDYEDEFIEGPLLDIGCGQNPYLIDLLKSKRTIYGIDNDSYQLEQLQVHANRYTNNNCENLITQNLTLLENPLPSEVFSVVLLSNILHFFTLEDCRKIIAEIVQRTTEGSLVYLKVHSSQHYTNAPDEEDNNTYFKHYFTQDEVDGLFDKRLFTRIYAATIHHKLSKKSMSIIDRWLDKCIDFWGMTDPQEIQDFKEENVSRGDESALVCIYRREQTSPL
ncbi:hypothetical protein PK28_17145 (plasmid) [Hymenobacter sp. DG25B]|uniref:class I SAM-dependent methyltransferase n=1 Tax=Hymenobacter sp. DG25B TaxID=1385664 RepID=UPI00054083F5|nr:class I SAM-dependent methyltransferase [Hymenobacter sp. DG25B]AIZ65398.1 hypothetical protein PK28_17145 [Hymenobacter sp. DG25B]